VETHMHARFDFQRDQRRTDVTREAHGQNNAERIP
jgi:hypothetical protein